MSYRHWGRNEDSTYKVTWGLVTVASTALSLAAQLSSAWACGALPGWFWGRSWHGGSEEVTLEVALCPGISPWDPTERQECGPELAEGYLEGWPGLCLAPHKCPGRMGSVGEFPLCQQQPRLWGGSSHCGSREACKPVTKESAEISAGSQMGRLGSTRTGGQWGSSVPVS